MVLMAAALLFYIYFVFYSVCLSVCACVCLVNLGSQTNISHSLSADLARFALSFHLSLKHYINRIFETIYGQT